LSDEELETIEDPEGKPSFDYAGKKRHIVLLLLAYSAICGIVACFLPEKVSTALQFIVSLPFLLLGVSWCFTDAAERDHRIGLLTRILLIVVFVVGLPIYLLQTRGISAIKTLALTLLLVGAMVTCMFVTMIATVFVGGVAGLWVFEF
jgi:hypothetical protein